jgi:hypothetical protein
MLESVSGCGRRRGCCAASTAWPPAVYVPAMGIGMVCDARLLAWHDGHSPAVLEGCTAEWELPVRAAVCGGHGALAARVASIAVQAASGSEAVSSVRIAARIASSYVGGAVVGLRLAPVTTGFETFLHTGPLVSCSDVGGTLEGESV